MAVSVTKFQQKLCCIVEYDGTDFHGFQRQPDRVTIQGVIEDALESLNRGPTIVHGAGRTDAGVHAEGQTFHFDARVNIPSERWPLALNSRLPAAVVVTGARVVADDFHARKNATGKVYRYKIYNGPYPSVFADRWALHVERPLDVEAMSRAAALVVGRRDFAAFRASGSTPLKTTVRNLRRLDVERRGRFVEITAEADGFLYHMMRNLAGSLLLVGRGRRSPEWMGEVLASRDRNLAGPTAPARGLCLVEVKYG